MLLQGDSTRTLWCEERGRCERDRPTKAMIGISLLQTSRVLLPPGFYLRLCQGPVLDGVRHKNCRR